MSSPLDQRVKIAAHQTQSGRLDLAIPALQAVLQQDPAHAEAARVLAMAVFQAGQHQQGLTLMRRAASSAPQRADIQFMLASMLAWTGQLGEAVTVLRTSIELDPSKAQPHALLATCLLQMGDSDSAEDEYRASIEIEPKHPEARTNYATIMNSTARSSEAVRILRETVKDHPGHLGALTNYCVALNYSDTVAPAEIVSAHQQYGRAVAALPAAARVPLHTDRDPGRRLRIGIISPDLFEHSVGYFVRAMVEPDGPGAPAAPDGEPRPEWFVYATSGRNDAQTQRIRAAAGGAEHWREVPPRTPDSALVDLIRSDRIDILIELSGHTQGHRLPALGMRAAPVQVTMIGYPNTTGVPAIDYRIVDSITDPPGAEARATEILVRLDPCFLCYTPPDDAPAVVPPPSVQNGHITFGSFNSVKKITPATAALWAAALHAVPTSRLIIKSGGFSSKRARRQVSDMLKREGIPEVRFDLLDRIESKSGHLAAYELLDIALDTFPYHGTTTTCEALWMGVPVVTLEGTLHASRVGPSILTAVGMPELIARSQVEFAGIAASLAGDADRLRELRTSVRPRMAESVLCDRAAYARRFGAAIAQMWRTSAASAHPTSPM
jgi:predicted O-linked N-acetylglucosamine transferase (SPINDLY family)